MDDLGFRQLAVESAKAYLKYLEENNRGISVVNVSEVSKRGEKVYLHLQGRLSPAGLDSIKLKLYADEYLTDDICPCEYRSESSVLILRPKKALFALLPTGKCDHIAIISDLRFLVRRVITWYEAERPPISLPACSPCVNPPEFSELAGGAPTMEQYSAVRNILTTPFSYVWGAPGTGKTRYVLANCVLAYLRQDQKIILTAPTNNAVEQMLSGVLEVLLPYGIPSSRILRLGIPSAGFAAKYPDVCEQRSTENLRARLTKELDHLHQQLNAASSYAALQSLRSNLYEINKLLQEATTQFHTAWVSDDIMHSARSDVEQMQKAMGDTDRQVHELRIWIESLPGRLCRFFLPRRFSEKHLLLEKLTLKLRNMADERTMLIQRLRGLEQQKQTAGEQYYAQLDQLRTQYMTAIQTNPIPGRPIPAIIPLDGFPAHLQHTCDHISKSIEQMPVPAEMNTAELKDAIHTREEQLTKLDTDSQSRWSEVRVLAMTIDRYIVHTVPIPDFDPVHIFMDEAAYCSLIKGYTLLAPGCPVTLLGDHAQLPPVCEMNENELKKSSHSEFLWAQSAIHLDSVFIKSIDRLHDDYTAAAPPDFRYLQLSPLSATHRFGPSLSRILANFIYGSSFTSAISSETSVKYIHAPSSRGDVGRTSQAECTAIASLVKSFDGDRRNFAILSPYKKQISLLSQRMPSLASSGQIITVHAAQGREFHTIVLSVVDTTRKYFTNSSIPIGKFVLNTAVSRVKSELILVLDYDYWISQEHQMLCHLLRAASPY